MNHLLRAVTVSAALLGSACGAWAADSPEGNWRTIDDRSGFAKALVRIVKEADGTYSGTITKTIPRPDYTPQDFCHNCPAPYTGQKIVGLKILSGLQVDPQQPQPADQRQGPRSAVRQAVQLQGQAEQRRPPPVDSRLHRCVHAGPHPGLAARLTCSAPEPQQKTRRIGGFFSTGWITG